MDSLTNTRPISRLEIVDTGRRRRWSDETKVRIVEKSPSGKYMEGAAPYPQANRAQRQLKSYQRNRGQELCGRRARGYRINCFPKGFLGFSIRTNSIRI